eukprot:g623.t1
MTPSTVPVGQPCARGLQLLTTALLLAVRARSAFGGAVDAGRDGDCVVHAWGPWSACSAPCATAAAAVGKRVRTRRLEEPRDPARGAPCPFSTQTEQCGRACCAGHERLGTALDDSFLVQAAARTRAGTLVQALRSAAGHYRIALAAAPVACAERGMAVCTRAQLRAAWREGGLEVCACGWLAGGAMAYPMTHASPLCGGAAGVHDCGGATYAGRKADLFCCGERAEEPAPCARCSAGRFARA